MLTLTLRRYNSYPFGAAREMHDEKRTCMVGAVATYLFVLNTLIPKQFVPLIPFSDSLEERQPHSTPSDGGDVLPSGQTPFRSHFDVPTEEPARALCLRRRRPRR